jgi:hypothetical protein
LLNPILFLVCCMVFFNAFGDLCISFFLSHHQRLLFDRYL